MKNFFLFIELLLILTPIIWLCSCQKDWLNERSSQSTFTPAKLKDLQGLLDDVDVMNGSQYGSQCPIPALGELSVDDYYIDNSQYGSLTLMEKNLYQWEKEIYNGSLLPDWGYAYKTVFNANFVLENLEEIAVTDNIRADWNLAKGSAYFFRAHQFYHLAQLFAKPYSKGSAGSDLGIPLRLKTDPNEKSVRSTLQQTYDQILSDLHEALPLLNSPASTTGALFKTRPSKPAVYAMLARVYLVMGNYEKALTNADSCLMLYRSLIDYNKLNSTDLYPISLFNEEVIFHSQIQNTYKALFAPYRLINSDLVKLYEDNDLRKSIFLNQVGNGFSFKGNYTRGAVSFAGIAVDEIYLIQAECLARVGNVNDALTSLNNLLVKRWKAGTYIPVTITDKRTLISVILKERRKELLCRGIRWIDLRRLNTDPDYAITIKRKVNNVEYTLTPNSARYVMPIPDVVITLSGMKQNER